MIVRLLMCVIAFAGLMRIYAITHGFRNWSPPRRGVLIKFGIMVLAVFLPYYGASIQCLMMLMVPCGNETVNNNKLMWYGRQLMLSGNLGILLVNKL